MYVRISRGSYSPELHVEVSHRLDASSQSILAAIRRLPGCVSCVVGSDAESSTLVNVSVWDWLEHAESMSSLAEMLALAKEFITIGVEFERAIVDYDCMWQFP